MKIAILDVTAYFFMMLAFALIIGFFGAMFIAFYLWAISLFAGAVVTAWIGYKLAIHVSNLELKS